MANQRHIWSESDAQRLKSLRESVGLDISILARRLCLSVHQLRQLEEGGVDRFYSESIKLQTGRKVLRSLGADLCETTEPSDQSNPADQMALSQQEQDLVTRSLAIQPLARTHRKPIKFTWVLFLFGVSVLGVTALLKEPWATQASTDTTFDLAEVAALPEPQVPFLNSVSPEESTPVTQSPKVANSVSNDLHEFRQGAALGTASSDCYFGHEPKKLSVFEPRRPGNYIYFEAQEPITLCVRDAAKHITTLELPAGRGRTVRGEAPFEVLSQHFGGVRIFYQGKLVAPGLLTEHHIMLRPQAIVEPATKVE
jgi:transcriptional regulator with XRE-family HTH domain